MRAALPKALGSSFLEGCPHTLFLLKSFPQEGEGLICKNSRGLGIIKIADQPRAEKVVFLR